MPTTVETVPPPQTVKHGIWIMIAVGMAAIAAILLYLATANPGDTDVSGQIDTSGTTSVAVTDTTDEPNSESPLSEPLSQPLQDIPHVGDTAPVDYDHIDWSTYAQSEQGWSIDYPEGWVVYTSIQDQCYEPTVVSSKQLSQDTVDGFRFRLGEGGGYFIKEYASDPDWIILGISKCSYEDLEDPDDPSYPIRTTEEFMEALSNRPYTPLTIGSLEGVSRHDPSMPIMTYEVFKDYFMYVMTVIERDNSHPFEEGVIEHMLSTFRLL